MTDTHERGPHGEISLLDLCACMGPLNGDPFCPCAMKRKGLTSKSGPHGGGVIPAGMVAWHGGNAAPADWDGGPVFVFDRTDKWGNPHLRKCGHTVTGWQRDNDFVDIIAYTPKPDLAAHAASVVAMDEEDDSSSAHPLIVALETIAGAVTYIGEDDGDGQVMIVDYDTRLGPDEMSDIARAALAAYRSAQVAL